MQINGLFKYKSAIVLTPERMAELDNILNKYYPSFFYSAVIENESKIKFSNLREMISFDNALQHKIKSIIISEKDEANYPDLFIKIKPRKSIFFNFEYTVLVEYKLSNPDDEILLRNELSILFNKARAQNSFLYKFSLIQLLFPYTIWGILYYSYSAIFKSFDLFKEYTNTRMLFEFFIATWVLAICMFFPFLWMKIFPPIMFSWGEAIQVNRRLCDTRNKIFWGLIVASLISTFFFILALLI